MFEKTLTDIVKGIRASKRDTALYISQCIGEIKQEVQSNDLYVKANALNKLTFLQMMGYNTTFAAFACVETMSSVRFAHKRIGYLAATQGFDPLKQSDVILLCTNLLQKELKGGGSMGGGGGGGGSMYGHQQQRMYEAGMALNCIANIANADLARDVLPELLVLAKPPCPSYLRKKTLLCLYKLFLVYPQGLRVGFDVIPLALEAGSGVDASISNNSTNNPGAVVSCAVNVICELAQSNHPKNYLHLAPILFGFLTSSHNNWMLIKVVKLMGRLVPHEPRLARKLLEPLATIARDTTAKSLLYEAVYTITLCLPYVAKADGSMPAIVPSIVALCSATLTDLVQEADPNLKYLGLVGFGSLLQSHPKALLLAQQPNNTNGGVAKTKNAKPLILEALSDDDVTIRTRALELLKGMVTRRNLQELMHQLLGHVQQASASYQRDLIRTMIQLCSDSKYSLLIGNNDDDGSTESTAVSSGGGAQGRFQWYLDLLWQLFPYVAARRKRRRKRDEQDESSNSGDVDDKHDDDDDLDQLLSQQVTDVTLRVLPVRPYAVQKCTETLLRDDSSSSTYSSSFAVPLQVLQSLTWIVGEYADLIPLGKHAMLLQNLLAQPVTSGTVTAENDDGGSSSSTARHHSTDATTDTDGAARQAIALQASIKVFAVACSSSSSSGQPHEDMVSSSWNTYLPFYLESTHVEVQERAFIIQRILSSLNLLSTSGTISGGNLLMDNDDDDDAGQVEEDNLLGMEGTTVSSLSSSKGDKKKTKTSLLAPAMNGSSSLKNRCQSAAPMLNRVFKPEPMKPVSAKLQQRKIRTHQDSNHDDVNDMDINWVLKAVAKDDTATNTALPTNLSMDSVSFTQQKLLEKVGSTATSFGGLGGIGGSGSSAMEGFGSSSTGIGSSSSSNNNHHTSSSTVPDSSVSFQHHTPPPPATTNLNPAPKKQDPFYLDSANEVGAVGKSDTNGDRFGTIQLLDDDDDNNENYNARRKKKVSKKNKRTKGTATTTTTTTASNADLAIFANPTTTSASGQPAMATTIYASDDDDDDDDLLSPGRRKQTGGRGGGLASIDLTVDEDEDVHSILPTRQHRVVPDRPNHHSSVGSTKTKAKKTKKGGKVKKGKKKSQEPSNNDSGAGTYEDGDLLGFSTTPAPSTTNVPLSNGMQSTATPSNPISTAFDDLLSLEAAPVAAPTPLTNMADPFAGMTAPAPIGIMNDPMSAAAPSSPPMSSAGTSKKSSSTAPKKSKKKKKQPWMTAMLKLGSAEGSMVDWSKVQVYYRLLGSSTQPSLSIRVDNEMDHLSLNDLTIEWKTGGLEDDMELGTVGPNESSPEESAGPLQVKVKKVTASMDIKGVIQTSEGSRVPIKFVVPASFLHLQPAPSGLTQDDVMHELSSGVSTWSLQSLKLELKNLPPAKVQSVLSTFFQASVVEGSSAMMGTLAAFSSNNSGAKVRILYKVVKQVTIKVDIKCTNADLTSSLSNDLKRLLL